MHVEFRSRRARPRRGSPRTDSRARRDHVRPCRRPSPRQGSRPRATASRAAVLGAIGGSPAGDHESLTAVVATARAVSEVNDLIVLEHFSLAPAAAAVQSALSVPVLSSPYLVVDVLRGLLLETANG